MAVQVQKSDTELCEGGARDGGRSKATGAPNPTALGARRSKAIARVVAEPLQLTHPINPILEGPPDIVAVDCEDLQHPYTTRTEPGEALTPRELRKVLSAKTAQEALGEIAPGCDIYGITKGQFSLIDLIGAVIDQTGPVTLTISTWTAAAGDVETIKRWLDAGQITAVRFLIDFSFQRREPKIAYFIREHFGTEGIRVSKVHTKFILLDTDAEPHAWRLVIKTSMNLNMNPRMEDFEVTDDPRLWQFLTDLMAEIFCRQKAKQIDDRPYENVKRFNEL